MVMALKHQGRSTRYHQSSLREQSRPKSIAFLQDSRLLSRRIYHKHHFLEPFRMLIPYLLIATDRIGTYVLVIIELFFGWRYVQEQFHR